MPACFFFPPSTSNYEEGWQLQRSDDGSSSCGWWRAWVPTGWTLTGRCRRWSWRDDFWGNVTSGVRDEAVKDGRQDQPSCQPNRSCQLYSHTTHHCVFPCCLSCPLCITAYSGFAPLSLLSFVVNLPNVWSKAQSVYMSGSDLRGA